MALATRLEKLIDEFRQTPNASSSLLQALTKSWLKLDHYHAQTASAQAIALLFFFFVSLPAYGLRYGGGAIATILDPRYKLQAFRHLEWREEWITEAHSSFVYIYRLQYAPKPLDSDLSESITSDPPIGNLSSSCFWYTIYQSAIQILIQK